MRNREDCRKSKKIWLLMAAFYIMTAIPGCGRREKVNFGDENTVTDNQEGTSAALAGTLKEELGIPDSWVESVNYDSKVAIDAVVTVPDVGDMKVVQAEEKYYDSEDKRELLARLSEGEVYKYDVQYRTKQDLAPEIQLVEKIITSFGDAASEAAQDALDYQYETLAELQDLYNQAPEAHQPADDYSGDTYLFVYNDMEYIAQFTADFEHDFSCISIFPKDIREVIEDCPYDEVTPAKYRIERWREDENVCSISEEQAEAYALELADMVSDGDFVVNDIYPLCMQGLAVGDSSGYMDYNSYTNWYDGYVCVLGRNLDGVKVEDELYTGSMLPTWQIAEYSGFTQEAYGCERMVVCVNDAGLVWADYCSPYEYTAVVSEHVNLLTFERVQTMIREELLDKGYYENYTFHYMELMYFPLRSETNDEEYTIVPVWLLTDAVYTEEIKGYVVVNAIDGSIVNIGQQRYRAME